MKKLDLNEKNYSIHSWSIVIFKFADAKCVYDNPNAVLALQQEINNVV